MKVTTVGVGVPNNFGAHNLLQVLGMELEDLMFVLLDFSLAMAPTALYSICPFFFFFFEIGMFTLSPFPVGSI